MRSYPLWRGFNPSILKAVYIDWVPVRGAPTSSSWKAFAELMRTTEKPRLRRVAMYEKQGRKLCPKPA